MPEKRALSEKASKRWSDATILKAIPNPSERGFEIKIKNPEITFLGAQNQPDFATAFITMYPRNTVIELRSLKLYFFQFRDRVISYERLINVVYDDLIAVYDPLRLRIVMTLLARGGISSRLAVDSDWAIRGGKEEFRDWVGQSDEW